MPEPEATPRLVGEILPGIFRFTLHDDRIDFQSDCYCLRNQGRVVLIDPLPLSREDLNRLGQVEAICLTASCHERSAWRLRRQLNIQVHGPSGEWTLRRLPITGTGAEIGAGRPTGNSCSRPHRCPLRFFLDRHGGVVFCADLLTNANGCGLAFVPDEYQDDPTGTRDTVRKLLDLNFQALCSNHGEPILQEAKSAIAQLLARNEAKP